MSESLNLRRIIRNGTVLALTLAALTGCSDGDDKDGRPTDPTMATTTTMNPILRESLDTAHAAGFKEAVEDPEYGPGSGHIKVQVGSCWLPVGVLNDIVSLDPSVETNIKYNSGAVHFGVDRQLAAALEDVNSAELGAYLEKGIIGQEVCKYGYEEISEAIKQIEAQTRANS